MTFQEVNTQVNFPREEEKVLQFWEDNDTFQKSIDQRSKKKRYSFYDGPPFATGLPHYGHLLAGIIKDIVPRYWTMKGYHIERRFGWDCHGLPIEYEIDKDLGISGRKGVETFGIDKYNGECRKIVLRYTKEWEQTVKRIGRWVDFENDYKTMDPSFMESVWWVFKQLWEKDLVYLGYKVMPYSTAVATPLSNFEATSNYQMLQDPSITLTFKIKDRDNTYFLAWTTTPWTLPSNLALSVGPEIEYVKIKPKDDDRHFILASDRLPAYYKKKKKYEILETYTGKDLEGWEYEPLFDYFEDMRDKGAFQVLVGDHVTGDDGTGVVHTAPAFGEEDFNICQEYKIPPVMPVDDDGQFTDKVPDFAGQHVKEADKNVIKHLKDKGLVLRHETIDHRVPFCWRSDTPLIYRAISTWFVNVEKIKDRMIKHNQDTHWVPLHLRDGRFGNWLEGARDWAISRNRFWGNPIPLWHNKETDDYICVGSIEELEKLTGEEVTDLHMENIDSLEIPGQDGKGVYRRVSEVLDCWFESGAMPYAQNHYPFEDKKEFEQGFPADFIAEGLDQTRGWFYTLTVLGTALFDKIPFKNVIVNGMILAEDGKKMSKRLKNYPMPDKILSEHGADALRLYMIQSPAVRAEELRFSEDGVKDIVRRVLLKLWNAYGFFANYAVIDQWKPKKKKAKVTNILDKWILSRLHHLLATVEEEMAQYHLYNVVPAVLDFIEDLTNTYIRLNRKRFWSEDDSKDKDLAYQTLYEVLYTMSKVMAPFTPFLAEMIFENLSKADEKAKESVHLEDFPTADKKRIDPVLEESVSLMEQVLVMGRNLREKAGIKVKVPLKRLTVVHRDEKVTKELKKLESYLIEELNLRSLEYSHNESEYVQLSAKANGAVLGPKFGKKMGDIAKGIGKLTSDELFSLERGETVEIAGETIDSDGVQIFREPQPGHENMASNVHITVDIDATVDDDQVREGLSREVVNRIQKLRKSADFKLDNRIEVQYKAEGALVEAIDEHSDYICDQVLADKFEAVKSPKGEAVEEFDIDDHKLKVGLTVVD